MPGVRVSPPAGMRSKIVDYTGDGSWDRVIPVGFTPKFYAIFQRIDDVRDATENILGFESPEWSMIRDGGYPYTFARTFIQDNGINVGLISYWQGGCNTSGREYRLIAYA